MLGIKDLKVGRVYLNQMNYRVMITAIGDKCLLTKDMDVHMMPEKEHRIDLFLERYSASKPLNKTSETIGDNNE